MAKLKILIVEDETTLREMYRDWFENESFDVRTAENGEVALEKTRAERPDVILLDILMPKKSGLDVLKEMREDPALADIPVIILTAFSDPHLREKAENFGIMSFQVKSSAKIPDIISLIKDFFSSKK